MPSPAMSIGELADASGLTRRAVRFYVQQQLLPAPAGRGRGSHYDQAHVERLRKIMELQQAGYSLEAIRTLLNGEVVGPPAAPARPATRPVMSAELWTRVKLMEGVELHYDAARHRPEVEELLTLRRAVQRVFKRQDEPAQ